MSVLPQAVDGAILRLSNTEVRRCGQAFVLGRYCTHMHMANRQESSYIIDNSIHHSFQRATTIHGDVIRAIIYCPQCYAFVVCFRHSFHDG